MATKRYSYTTDGGSIFKCRMDSDTVLDTVRGTSAVGVASEEMHVRISKNKREAGISPRYVTYARAIGTESATTSCLIDTGKKYKNVMVLDVGTYNGIVTGDIGEAGVTSFTQNGATYYAATKHDEVVR